MTTPRHNTHVCPWWLAYTFDNPVRLLLHNPQKLLSGLVKEGDTALDIGCGMGHFSIGMAKLVGPNGRVISVDLQPEMLARVRLRAERQGLYDRLQLHRCQPDSLGVDESVDFALAFWMVHEIPNRAALLAEVRGLLKPEARFLVVEPKLHVSASDFQKTVDLARSVGFKLCAEPQVSFSRAVLFSLNSDAL
jgi:ubiquinone/menaquinone biosynthesis C-methylase UbiE